MQFHYSLSQNNIDKLIGHQAVNKEDASHAKFDAFTAVLFQA